MLNLRKKKQKNRVIIVGGYVPKDGPLPPPPRNLKPEARTPENSFPKQIPIP